MISGQHRQYNSIWVRNSDGCGENMTSMSWVEYRRKFCVKYSLPNPSASPLHKTDVVNRLAQLVAKRLFVWKVVSLRTNENNTTIGARFSLKPLIQ